jgi:hypothetical protein
MSYRFLDGKPVTHGPVPGAPEQVCEGGRVLGKLEDVTAANTWQAYRAGRIPPPDAGGPEQWLLERLEESWHCGAYFALVLAVRLRRETPERAHALIDRLLAEVEKRASELDHPGRASS